MDDHQPALDDSDAQRRPLIEPAPIGMTVVIVMVLLDVVLLFTAENHWPQVGWLVWIGLTFGQAAALVVRAFSRGVKKRWVALGTAFTAGAVLAMLTSLVDHNSFELEECMVFLFLFLAVQALVFAGMFILSLGRQRTDQHPRTPRFGVRHLLLLMIGIAVAATAIRYNLQALESLSEVEILLLVVSWSITAVAAGLLLLDRKPSLWRLGAFAGLGIAIGLVVSRLGEEEGYLTIHIVLMTVLAAALVLPQFDRYRLMIAIESRDDADEVSDLQRPESNAPEEPPLPE